MQNKLHAEQNIHAPFNSLSNSLKKDTHAPSSDSVVYQFINPLNCPLEIPEEAASAAGVGAFSAEGLVPKNMGCRNTEGRLIGIPLAVLLRCMTFIPSARLAVHHPLSVLLLDSVTQRCICTGSGGTTFSSTPLVPSIITVTPTATTTITMSAFMTTTTRAVTFTNRLGMHLFGLCDLCFIAGKRTYIRSVVRGVATETSYSKCIHPVTLRNVPFMHQI